jgi:hypothetical protein
MQGEHFYSILRRKRDRMRRERRKDRLSCPESRRFERCRRVEAGLLIKRNPRPFSTVARTGK